MQRNFGDLSVRYALAGVALRLGRYDVARTQYDAVQVLDPAYDGLPELGKALTHHNPCVVPHAG